MLAIMTMIDIAKTINPEQKTKKKENMNFFERFFNAPVCVAIFERMWTVFFRFFDETSYSLLLRKRQKINRQKITQTINWKWKCSLSMSQNVRLSVNLDIRKTADIR